MVKPILYYAIFSPPARAVLLTAKLLELDMELRIVDFAKKEHLSEEFIKINPQHTIPTLIDDGEVIWDSHAILPYLIGKFSKDDSLYPKNLVTRAKIDQRLHFDNANVNADNRKEMNTIIFGGKTEYQDESFKLAYDAYDMTEIFLKDDFLVGNSMTIADISCISDLNTLQTVVPIEPKKYPKLSAWFERMSKVPGYHEINDEGAKILATRLESCLKLNRENVR